MTTEIHLGHSKVSIATDLGSTVVSVGVWSQGKIQNWGGGSQNRKTA